MWTEQMSSEDEQNIVGDKQREMGTQAKQWTQIFRFSLRPLISLQIFYHVQSGWSDNSIYVLLS